MPFSINKKSINPDQRLRWYRERQDCSIRECTVTGLTYNITRPEPFFAAAFLWTGDDP
jgi:hypothetical protein